MSATMAENCGESGNDRRTPDDDKEDCEPGRAAKGERSCERGAATDRERRAGDAGLAEAVRECASPDAGWDAREHAEEGREFAERDRCLFGKRGRKGGGGGHADPSPEHVEFPHVPEISGDGGADSAVRPGEADGPWMEGGGAGVVGAEIGPKDESAPENRESRG